MVVGSFYFEFPGRKVQSATRMLGSFLKQIVSGMERIPGSRTETEGYQSEIRALGCDIGWESLGVLCEDSQLHM